MEGDVPESGSPTEDPSPLTTFLRQRFSSGRSDSIIPTEGREGTKITRLQYSGKVMAVFTSGGDAPGIIF